jgi:hypothetical protein
MSLFNVQRAAEKVRYRGDDPPAARGKIEPLHPIIAGIEAGLHEVQSRLALDPVVLAKGEADPRSGG